MNGRDLVNIRSRLGWSQTTLAKAADIELEVIRLHEETDAELCREHEWAVLHLCLRWLNLYNGKKLERLDPESFHDFAARATYYSALDAQNADSMAETYGSGVEHLKACTK